MQLEFRLQHHQIGTGNSEELLIK